MEFENRSIINGKLLKEHMGENVCIMVKVETVDGSGKMFRGKTSDNVNIQVNVSEPLNGPIADWVEVIGIPAGQNAIRCKEIILFEKIDGEEEFDAESHNMLINFMSNCKDFYKVE